MKKQLEANFEKNYINSKCGVEHSGYDNWISKSSLIIRAVDNKIQVVKDRYNCPDINYDREIYPGG